VEKPRLGSQARKMYRKADGVAERDLGLGS
jgi:hypothetical protein